MDFFLVGGSIRDAVFGKASSDHDFVVVNATEEQLLELGLKKVGKAFPVFITDDGTEIAMARRENSTGEGYNDFEVETDGVTLDEDLLRRDFTINACASAVVNGGANTDELICAHPMSRYDLAHRILRVVDADRFKEDPLRILRGLRFAARHNLFIEPETKALFRQMIEANCLAHLPKERIWKEIEKAASAENFWKFISLCGKFNLFPEISGMKGVRQPKKYHPEGDVLNHTVLALKHYEEVELPQYGWNSGDRVIQSLCILCHDMGKRLTLSERGNLHGHESDVRDLLSFVERIGAPKSVRVATQFCAEQHHRVHGMFVRRANRLALWLEEHNQFNNQAIVNALCMTCVSDANARLQKVPYLQMNMLAEVVSQTRKLSPEVVEAIKETDNIQTKKQLIHKSNVEKVGKILARYLQIQKDSNA